MIADFDDFVTWVFCIVDDIWQEVAVYDKRPGPQPTSCSDSELVTVAIVSECRGWSRETEALQEWTNYRRLIPRLPERSRFNRRRRALQGALNQLRRVLLAVLDVAQDAHGAIDSLPLPVVSFHGAPQRSRDWDANQASFGWCASKKQKFFGYRLHLVVTLGGVILDFVLTAADGDEREVAEGVLANYPGRTFLGDKGYVSGPLAERLQAVGVGLIALRRENQHQQLPPALRRLNQRFRQIIETVNGQLADQFSIEQNHARSCHGLCARLVTKLTAHTLCIYLNRLLGNPDWLQIKALAFPN
jgi:IS5 family transposase